MPMSLFCCNCDAEASYPYEDNAYCSACYKELTLHEPPNRSGVYESLEEVLDDGTLFDNNEAFLDEEDE